MKVLVRNASLGPILKWAQRGLFSAAALMLGFCTFVVADTWIFQHREQETLERLQTGSSGALQSLPGQPGNIGPDGLIGRIEIQRLNMSVAVVEGTGTAALRRAVGHIAGTALPGQPGNIGIAAHRDTFFRPLRNIQRGDIVTLTTPRGEYRYSVVSTKVVDPDDVAVLNSDGSEILTLVTCYPFYFVGAAPNRFIVRAKRIRDQAD